MTSKQSHYTITYDDFNDSFLCVIDGETISANFVGEILSYIAKLYDFEPKIIYSELHYAKVLENELNITIEIKDQEDIMNLGLYELMDRISVIQNTIHDHLYEHQETDVELQRILDNAQDSLSEAYQYVARKFDESNTNETN